MNAAARYAPAPTFHGGLAPAGQASPEAAVGPDGHVYGIDGMLDQVAGALARQARTELLPAIQADRELQETIGRAAGREVAKPLWILAGLAAVYVGYRLCNAR